MPIRIMHGRNARPPLFLREWRENRGLTQQQLADRLDTTAATVSRIESGKRDYTGDFLWACAYALNCHASDLLSRPPTQPSLDALTRDAPEKLREKLQLVVKTILDSAA